MNTIAYQPALPTLSDWQVAVAFVEVWGIAECVLNFSPPRHGELPRLLLASVHDIRRCFAGCGAVLKIYRSDAGTFAELDIGGVEVCAVVDRDDRVELGEFVL